MGILAGVAFLVGAWVWIYQSLALQVYCFGFHQYISSITALWLAYPSYWSCWSPGEDSDFNFMPQQPQLVTDGSFRGGNRFVNHPSLPPVHVSPAACAGMAPAPAQSPPGDGREPWGAASSPSPARGAGDALLSWHSWHLAHGSGSLAGHTSCSWALSVGHWGQGVRGDGRAVLWEPQRGGGSFTADPGRAALCRDDGWVAVTSCVWFL